MAFKELNLHLIQGENLNMKNLITITLGIFLNTVAFSAPTSILTQDGEMLKAELMMPVTSPVGAVLILQGSGNVDLDGDVSSPLLGAPLEGQSGKLSLQIAESLAKKGIASLRYSKRGVDNTAQLENQKLPFLADDAEAAYLQLKNLYPELKTGIIGFSEGAIVATLVSGNTKLDGLFLMAPPVRHIDSMLGYQFIEWPTNLLLSHLKVGTVTTIDANTLSINQNLKLPLLGTPINTLDLDHDGKILVASELFTTYQNQYFAIRGLLESPLFKGWYESFKNLPRFAELAAKIQAPTIQIYQGVKDAQTNWAWLMEDLYMFPVKPSLHLYENLGHCFSPMTGEYGEVKTTGSLDAGMLEQLTSDVSKTLN